MKSRHTVPAQARAIALTLLDRLEKGPCTLDRLIETTLDGQPDLDQRERSLVFALVYGVQRWRSRLDRIAAHFATRSWSRIDPAVVNILRLALFQILFLDRIPHSAAVDTAVALAKDNAPGAAGFVNALLRTALRQGVQAALDPPSNDPVAALALETAFPPWLVSRWVKRDGLATARLRCEAANRIAPLTARINRLKTSRRDLLTVWQNEGLVAAPTPLSADGIVISNAQGPVRQVPGYDRGWFQIQDEAAQLVSLLVAPAGGMRILDACAGRGGKTGHLAALAQDRAAILATDPDARKLADLTAEMQRLGIDSVESRTADWLAEAPPGVDGLFDAVLVDAPCSGLGVIGRNPDIKWRRQEKDVHRQARRQSVLAGALAHRVKPGGALVYAVCSLEAEETDGVIGAFLRQRPDFVIQAPRFCLPPAAHRLIDAQGFVRSDPALEPMDGFFMVRLVRTAAP